MKTDKQTTENILNAICSLLNDLSSHLERLRPPGDKNNLFSLELNRLAHEISRTFDQRKIDVEHLTGLLLSRSSNNTASWMRERMIR